MNPCFLPIVRINFAVVINLSAIPPATAPIAATAAPGVTCPAAVAVAKALPPAVVPDVVGAAGVSSLGGVTASACGIADAAVLAAACLAPLT